MTDLEVIEAGVAALYSGNAERAVELFGRDDDLIRREAAYQAAIGGRLTLACTEKVNTPGTFTCHVPYHNALTDAVGYLDSPGDFIHVVVQDGVITQFDTPNHLAQGFAHGFPEHNFLLRTVVSFLREEVEGSEGCWDVPTDSLADIRTPECAHLIMDHLDDWAAWYEVVEPTPTTLVNERWWGPDQLAQWRTRLYLLDYPGESAQVLAIAVISPETDFERVLEKATPIVESLEIHAP